MQTDREILIFSGVNKSSDAKKYKNLGKGWIYFYEAQYAAHYATTLIKSREWRKVKVYDDKKLSHSKQKNTFKRKRLAVWVKTIV
jgi:hypothetical protein